MVGDSDVGKSNLIRQFSDDYSVFMGVSTIEMDGKTIKVEILDTGKFVCVYIC